MARYDFDLAVIGGGAAGLTASGLGAALGARTALISSGPLGGDCTWHGCVPSKALLKSARIAQTVRAAGGFGIEAGPPQVVFADVMARVRAIRQHIYEEADAPRHFERMGIEVIAAHARFLDPHTLDCGGRRLTARYFVIATGSRPRVPDIRGIEAVGYLTNETVFDLPSLPPRLVVVGAGPIGAELAQAFRRLGSEVALIGARLLPKDDPEAAEVVAESLRNEGVALHVGRAVQVQPDGCVTLDDGSVVVGGAVLVASGRVIDVRALNLEAAGVAHDASGVKVNSRGRTSAPHIYAAGDVSGRHLFTHMAEHSAKVAVTNLLLKVPMKIDEAGVAWCTYTDPEVAHVGRSDPAGCEVYRFPFSKLDRALTDGEPAGMIKVLASRGGGRVLGATIVGPHAGDMLGEFSLAVKRGIKLRHIADTIHAYPTWALGNRRVADQWYVRRQSPALIRALQWVFGYRGRVPDPPDPNRIV